MTNLRAQFERAREIAPYADDAKVEHLTRMLVDMGATIFQTHKLAATDREHVAILLEKFDPPHGAVILDVGSGVGAVTAKMQEFRPDLRCVLLNISMAQLGMSSPQDKTCGDMHALPFMDGSFDCVMFNFSLGHGLLDGCLAEAARVLRPDGVLFIYDIATADYDYLIERMGYRAHQPYEVRIAAERHGLTPVLIESPAANTDDFVSIFGSLEPHGIDRTWPMLYRFVK